MSETAVGYSAVNMDFATPRLWSFSPAFIAWVVFADMPGIELEPRVVIGNPNVPAPMSTLLIRPYFVRISEKYA